MNFSLTVVSVSIIGLLFNTLFSVQAQKNSSVQLPNYREVNFLNNVNQTSSNPTALSDALVRDYLYIDLQGELKRGNWHAVDASDKVNQLNFQLEGAKSFHKVDCYGKLSYLNQKQYERRWNSTLFIDAMNPFILGDSIKSDFNSEQFHLQGTASCQLGRNWKAGIDLQYKVGSSANQTDPRPKTNSMNFIVSPGISYQLTEHWNIGVSGLYSLFNETITHTLINSLYAYTYFRFKGLGSYSGIGTGSLQTYPRDYNGNTYQGALQLTYGHGKDAFANSLEVGYSFHTEDARDGGQTFTFLGGDFEHKTFFLKERVSFRHSQYVHNLSLELIHDLGESSWYEQTQYLDTDKNNQVAYKVHQKDLIQKEKQMLLNVDYQIDYLKKNLPSSTLLLKGSLQNVNVDHYEQDGFFNKQMLLYLQLQGKQKWFFGDRRYCSVLIGGEYRLPLSQSLDTNQKIYTIYTAPQIEYQTGAYYGLEVRGDYQWCIRGNWIGLFVQIKNQQYVGEHKYSLSLNNSHRISYQGGITFAL